MKKHNIALTIALAAGLSTPLAAKEDYSFSGNAAVVSQYLFRGFDLNMEDPVIQGGADFEHKSGFSAGIWGSNYDLGVDDGVEVDLYAAYGFSVGKDVGLSVGVTKYTYSGDVDATTEYNVGISVKDFSATYYYDKDLKTDYYELGYSLGLTDAAKVDLHYGHYKFDDGSDSNDLGVTLHYALNTSVTLDIGATTIDVDGLDDYVWAGVSTSF